MTFKPTIRELVLEKGLSFASDSELIMLLLGSGIKEFPIDKMAKKISSVINTTDLSNLVPELLKMKGIGISKALLLGAALELGRRKTRHLKAVVKMPKDIIPFVLQYSIEPKEHFLCITLNGAHEIIKIHVTSIGTLTQTLIHPREIFSSAIVENASAIIVCHNHPSGNSEPSEDDINSTKILLKASKLLGIALLDHIIIGGEEYFSFKEHNLLFN